MSAGNYNKTTCRCPSNCEELKFSTSVNKYKIDHELACDDDDGSFGARDTPDINNKFDMNTIVAEKFK